MKRGPSVVLTNRSARCTGAWAKTIWREESRSPDRGLGNSGQPSPSMTGRETSNASCPWTGCPALSAPTSGGHWQGAAGTGKGDQRLVAGCLRRGPGSSPRRGRARQRVLRAARPPEPPPADRSSWTCGRSCSPLSATSCREASPASPSLAPVSSTPRPAVALKTRWFWRTSRPPPSFQAVKFAELGFEVTEIRGGVGGTSCGT